MPAHPLHKTPFCSQRAEARERRSANLQARKEKLKELMVAEQGMYDEELSAHGLAIFKNYS